MPVSHIDVLREDAYMLFYVRQQKPTVRAILFYVEYNYLHQEVHLSLYCKIFTR